MRYFIDCEFDGFQGDLLSMAMVSEDGDEIYWIDDQAEKISNDLWVRENVLPILEPSLATLVSSPAKLAQHIADFIHEDPQPVIVADWPDDIKYFCKAIITEPGKMIPLPSFKMEVIRVDAYPTTLRGAIQHNALWDARALHTRLLG